METSTSDRKKKNCKLDIYIYIYIKTILRIWLSCHAQMFLLRLSIVLQTTWHFFFEWFLLLLLFFFLFFLSHFISLYFYIKHRCTEHCSAKLWSALKTNDDLEIKKKCKNERGRLIVHRRALSIRRSLYFRINRSFVLCIYYRNVIFVLL